MRTMHSLEYLKHKIINSSSISKNRDETIKSFDLVSSPELGKTKDTSAFSGTKIMNNLTVNKTQISLNNNSSILGNINMQKLVTNDDLSMKRNSEKGVKHIGGYSAKAKYLTGSLDPQECTSFAAKIEAINFRESKKPTILKRSSK
jgi:hypothetical protein